MLRMTGPTNEIEVKLPFDSAVAARAELDRVGAVLLHDRRFEDNQVYDQDRALKSRGCLLRLRRVGNEALLTFKAPVPGVHRHKVREEHETRVSNADALERILGGLGFVQVYRYQKYRSEFKLGGLHISLDETPIGVYVELEGAPDDIDRTAHELGFLPNRYVRDSYRRLHEDHVLRHGLAMGDLLMDDRNEDSSS